MNNPSDTPSSLDADHEASTPTNDAEAPVKPVRRRRAPKAEAAAEEAAQPVASATAGEAVDVVAAEASPVKRRRRPAASDDAAAQAELPLQQGEGVVAVKPTRSRAPKADTVFKAQQSLATEPVPVADGGPNEAPPAPVSATTAATVTPELAPRIIVPAEPASTVEAAAAPLPMGAAAQASPTEGGETSSETSPESPEQQQREGGRRRNRRDRKRGPRPDGVDTGATPSPVANFDDAQDADDDNEPAAPRPAPADVNEVFAQVLAGDFDGEDAAPSPDEAPQKRVLLPEPDAPKLHKVLAQAGVGSRRDMEQLIADGHITVNGEPAHTGQRISFGDQVKVNGKPIRFRIQPPAPRIIAYHKPAGEVVTNDDPQQRPTVFRRLPRLPQGKWQSVGRLDINTEGLLLFTNSGELANQLMHPRFGVEREYAVRVLGSLDEDQREELLDGVHVDGQEASFRSIEDGGGEGANRWYRVVITEGRNREVRKLFDAVGLTVSRLIRIRYGTVVLPRGLKRGVWVDLDDTDVRTIRRLTGTDGPRRDGNVGGKPNQPGRNNDRQGQGPGQGQGQGQQGKRGRDRNRGDRPNGPGGLYGQGGGAPNNAPVQQHAAPRGDFDPDADHEEDFGPIPNPLEQTFDRRFAGKSRPFATGFGNPNPNHNRGGNAPNRNGPREPDPMQTSVGYIGADAFHRKGNRGGSGSGGGGGRSGGGGGGGNRGGGGGGGNRGGSGFGGGGGGRRGR